MSYISNNLCHFVGRTKSSDDERFALLMQIIKEGQLKANLANPQAPGMSTHSNYQGDHLGEILKSATVFVFAIYPMKCLEYTRQNIANLEWAFQKHFLHETEHDL